MKRIVLILCVSLPPTLAFAQNNHRIDSLEQLLQSNLSDRERVQVLNELAFEFINYDSAKTSNYVQQSIALAEGIDYPAGIVRANVQLGWAFFRSGHMEAAVETFEEAYALANTLNDTLSQAQLLHGMGSVFTDMGKLEAADSALDLSLKFHLMIENSLGEALVYNQKGIVSAYRGDFHTCLEYFLKALVIQERLNNRDKLSGNYNNIAIVYENLNEEDKALEYYEKAMEINRENNDLRGLAINYSNIITIYENQGRKEEAYQLSLQSLGIYQSLGNKLGVAISLSNIGQYHMDQARVDSALYYLKWSLRLREELENPNEQVKALVDLGRLYLMMNNPSSAISYLNPAREICQDYGLAEFYSMVLENLAKAYKMQGNYRLAYEYQVDFTEMGDSLMNDEKRQDIIRLEEQFAYQKKTDSLQFIRDTERMQFESEIGRRQMRETRIMYGVIILVVIILALVLLYYYKQRANAKLVRLNQEIEQQKRELEEINALKSRLFSIVSHDIKSPIGVLVGFSEVLINHVSDTYGGKEDPQLDVIKKHIEDSKIRLLALLEDLINWVKSSSGTLPFKPSDQVVAHIATICIDNVQSQAVAKDITINLDVREDVTIYGDPNTLKVIFRNLLSNAIKFTNRNGEVTLQGYRRDDATVVEVIDTGIGIPAEALDKIFLAQKDQVRSGTGGEKGVGLGLSVVKEFVEINGGQIEVKSTEGEGTTFILTFHSKEIKNPGQS